MLVRLTRPFEKRLDENRTRRFTAGRLYEVDDATAAEMIDGGFGVGPDGEKPKADQENDDETSDREKELEKMTREQLDAEAKKLGVDISGAKNKGDVIEKILAHESQED